MKTELYALDPLFLNNVKLFIRDVLSLERTENVSIELYNFHDHVIKFVEICGIIVGVENKSNQILYTVEDSTGTIACSLWNEPLNFSYKPLTNGTLVRILGKIASFRDQKQIYIYDIFAIEDPNEELLHFVETNRLQKEYQKPYSLPTETEIHYDLASVNLQNGHKSLAAGYTVKSFADVILNVLKERVPIGDSFTVSLPQNDSTIKAFAEEILRRNNEKPEDYRIQDLFKQAMNILIADGSIASEGTRNGLYIIVDKREIEDFVMSTIDDECKKKKFRAGIRKEYIQLKIREKYNLEKKYATKLTQQTLSDLFDRGLIYPTGDKEYRVTFD